MIRVVIFLAGVATLPLLGLAAVPASAAPPKRVQDSYYLKRQQTKTEPPAQDPTDLGDGEGDPEAVTAGPSVPGIASGASFTPDMVRLPQTGSDAAYAQRQNVAASAPTAGQPMHYASGGQQQLPEEQVESQESGDSSGYDCDASEDCDEGCGPMGIGCFAAAVNAVPTCNVLWNEIYSCRCMWTSFDYLGYWVKGNHVPPLVTTSPNGTSQTQAGILGQPGTSILFGDQRINGDMRSGGRVTVGGWLVGDVIGIEATYFGLGTATTNFSAATDFNAGLNDQILARPYFNPAPPITSPPPPHPALPPAQSAELVAFPNFALPGGGTANLNGNINVTSSSSLQSAGFLLRRLVGVDLVKDHRMFLLGGYRWLRLEEGLMITDNVNVVGGGIPPGSAFSNLDSFGTRNQFNGGDIGLLSDLRRGRWVLETTGKVALGDMHESVNIDGQTKVTSGSSVVGYPGGVLTQVSNMGVYRRDQFAVIPELNLKLGFQITQGLRATAGYNFTYVSRVARPGNEVDFTVNPPYSPGAAQIVARPQYLNNPTDLWLQGFTVGFDYRW